MLNVKDYEGYNERKEILAEKVSLKPKFFKIKQYHSNKNVESTPH